MYINIIMKYQKLQTLLLNSKNSNESCFLFTEIELFSSSRIFSFFEVLVLSFLKPGFLKKGEKPEWLIQ